MKIILTTMLLAAMAFTLEAREIKFKDGLPGVKNAVAKLPLLLLLWCEAGDYQGWELFIGNLS